MSEILRCVCGHLLQHHNSGEGEGTFCTRIECGCTYYESDGASAAVPPQVEAPERTLVQVLRDVADYVQATEFWQLEPHDAKERTAYFAQRGLRSFVDRWRGTAPRSLDR